VIILGTDEGVDADDAVTTGPILDDDGLAPQPCQPLGQHPAADVGAAAGAKRQYEMHRSRRPRLS
jgi:hypothetical protein